MAHKIDLTDSADIADIVHQSVSDYHAFDTINTVKVEADGDGASFTVGRNGQWFEVTIRPAAPCAECGFPEDMHNGTDEVFVPVNAPVIPSTACDVTDCHGHHGPDYH